MKAMVLTAPETPFQLMDMPDPIAGPGEIVVDIHAASVNGVDWKVRSGRSGPVSGFPYILGRDFSGIVSGLGEGVGDFAIGDAVFAVCGVGQEGAYAQKIAIDASIVAKKPQSLSHVEAASLALAGLTALVSVEDTLQLQAGETILIQGGAGGVAAFAIELAKHIGATVATTASETNAEYVQELGADVVIDYRSADFTQALSNYDLVFDTMGGEVHLHSYAVLAPGGRMTYLNADPIPDHRPRDDVTVSNASVSYDTASLERIAELVDSGAIRPQVSAVVPLSEAVSAYDLSQTGHLRGKVVLRVR